MQPAGWWVKDKKNREHFYNQFGYLEAVDEDAGDETKKDARQFEW